MGIGNPASRSLKFSFALKGETHDSLNQSAIQTEICLWLHSTYGSSCLLEPLLSARVSHSTHDVLINLALCLPCPPCSPDLQSETDWARGMLKVSEVSAGCPGWELDRWGMAECSYKASSVNISSLVASVCVVALCDD